MFLLKDHSLYASITSDEFHAPFHLYGLSGPARSGLKAKKIQKTELAEINENSF